MLVHASSLRMRLLTQENRRATPATISAATRAATGASSGREPERTGAADVRRREQRARHDGDSGDELPGLQADGVADPGDHAEIDGKVDGLGPGGRRLERFLGDGGHAVPQNILERERRGAQAFEDAAGGRVRRSRPPSDERKVRRWTTPSSSARAQRDTGAYKGSASTSKPGVNATTP